MGDRHQRPRRPQPHAGVLEAATVVAADASLADAAATAVANAGYVEDRAVVRAPAETIDAHTDITGLHVTASAGPLPEEKKNQALNQAIRRAEALIDHDIVLGAFVACQGRTAMTRFVAERLRTTS